MLDAITSYLASCFALYPAPEYSGAPDRRRNAARVEPLVLSIHPIRFALPSPPLVKPCLWSSGDTDVAKTFSRPIADLRGRFADGGDPGLRPASLICSAPPHERPNPGRSAFLHSVDPLKTLEKSASRPLMRQRLTTGSGTRCGLGRCGRSRPNLRTPGSSLRPGGWECTEMGHSRLFSAEGDCTAMR